MVTYETDALFLRSLISRFYHITEPPIPAGFLSHSYMRLYTYMATYTHHAEFYKRMPASLQNSGNIYVCKSPRTVISVT